LILDQNSQKQKVLVAMTGRLDSTVAAYLLKKQGHQVFGICVLFLETEEEKQLFPEWDIPQIQRVKEICDALDITFYGVQGHDYFHAKIDEYLISSKLSGQAFNGEIVKNQALIEVLMEKADKLGADIVATGHFAKLTRNQSTDQFYLLMGSDHEQDQSFCLSRLTQKQMRRLSFPLSEVRKEQVEKIKHLFNFELLPPVVKKEKPVEKLVRYIERRSPEKHRKTGMVMNFKEDQTLGENDGIHYYSPGMSKVFLKDMHTIDSHYRVVSVDPAKGNVFVEFDKEIITDHVVLTSLVMDEKMDTSKPTEYFFKIGQIAGKHAGLFMMKNNGKALVELTTPLKEVAPFGEYVVMYDRKGTGGRVLASGRIEKSGLMTEFGLETIPFSLRRHLEDEDESESKEEEAAKAAKKKSALSDMQF
jgi:tRNA-specific 2-thiouridylase